MFGCEWAMSAMLWMSITFKHGFVGVSSQIICKWIVWLVSIERCRCQNRNFSWYLLWYSVWLRFSLSPNWSHRRNRLWCHVAMQLSRSNDSFLHTHRRPTQYARRHSTVAWWLYQLPSQTRMSMHIWHYPTKPNNVRAHHGSDYHCGHIRISATTMENNDENEIQIGIRMRSMCVAAVQLTAITFELDLAWRLPCMQKK